VPSANLVDELLFDETDAVWRILGEEWNELIDPITSESMDLAFVITPEPATV
jgi:hypothetical protein